VRHRGRLVEKTFLMEAVWPDNVVEEANLAQHIFTLRRVLGDSADEPRYIETVPGRGYRFVASIDSNQKSVQRSVAADRNGFEIKHQQHAELDAAYRHYLRGRFFWSKCSKESLEKSLDCFHQALALAPGYAAAYAGLADSYFRLSTSYWPPKDAYPKAMAAVLKALELDETLGEAHTALAEVEVDAWNWRAAELGFNRAIELSPNYPTARHWHAELLSRLGRHDEAVREIKRAQELDPLSIPINAMVGHVLMMARRYDEAIDQFKKTLELDGGFNLAATSGLIRRSTAYGMMPDLRSC
jgi:tetratricopeptide (TPR) repeat protein